MPQRPAAFGVQAGVEIRVALIQQFRRFKVIKPQQPVGLIQPVLPEKGRLEALRGGQELAVGHGQIGRIKDPLELILLIEPLGKAEDMEIRLRRGADDHLGGLSGRSEPGSAPVQPEGLPGL